MEDILVAVVLAVWAMLVLWGVGEITLSRKDGKCGPRAYTLLA